MNFRFHYLLLASFVLGLSVGCTQEKDPFNVYSVSGTVKYDNEILDGANVTFIPANKQSGTQSASGYTDVQGKYTLRTDGIKKAGALDGEYIVLVSKIAGGHTGEITDEQRREALLNPRATSGETKQIIPEKYRDRKQTTLKATVEAKDGNVIDFILEK